jgi:hypothetical protein
MLSNTNTVIRKNKWQKSLLSSGRDSINKIYNKFTKYICGMYYEENLSISGTLKICNKEILTSHGSQLKN